MKIHRYNIYIQSISYSPVERDYTEDDIGFGIEMEVTGKDSHSLIEGANVIIIIETRQNSALYHRRRGDVSRYVR